MIHDLKIDRRFADAIHEGRKTFEVRRNNRGFNAGDRVRFTVVKPGAAFVLPCDDHPLNGAVYRITYVLSGWGIEEGYVVFSITPDNDAMAERGR